MGPPAARSSATRSTGPRNPPEFRNRIPFSTSGYLTQNKAFELWMVLAVTLTHPYISTVRGTASIDYVANLDPGGSGS